ncbi:MAG: hypothetical protein ACC633_03910, partial [Anaerolineales bacterium]
MTNHQQINKKESSITPPEKSIYSEQKLFLAGKVLNDIEGGLDVFKAIRQHPLPEGAGFLSK